MLRDEDTGAPLRAHLQYEMGRISRYFEDLDGAIEHYRISLNIDQDLDNAYGVGKAFHRLGDVYSFRTSLDWTDAIQNLQMAKSAFEKVEARLTKE